MPDITLSFLGRSGTGSRTVREIAEEQGWGMMVDETGGGEAAAEELPENTVLAVVLAGENESSEALAARVDALRRRGIPVLLLAEPSQMEAARATWRCGADDFALPDAPKPELHARLEILAQGMRERHEQRRIQLGHVMFDRVRRVLHDGQQEVHLTSRECVLLEALAACSGAVVARDDLAQRVWGNEGVRSRESNVLEVYINYLRKKLALLGVAERLRTVRGVGYALVSGSGETDAQPTSS
jgi:DNA-binding response OmpR family regulator